MISFPSRVTSEENGLLDLIGGGHFVIPLWMQVVFLFDFPPLPTGARQQLKVALLCYMTVRT